MNASDFLASLSADAPPPGLHAPLQALWWDARGDWHAAHELVVPDETGRDAAWVHAYLHRKEGDDDNARYWYERAGQAPTDQPLGEEWGLIVTHLLDGPHP